MTLAELNALDRAGFVAALGHVFEASPWVAEAAWELRPFADPAALHAAMRGAVEAAGAERQLALIRAHPELAGSAVRSGALAPESRREQAGAGLDRLSAGESAEFDRLNLAYRRRFGFPFVIAVKGLEPRAILAACGERLANPAEVERRRALEEIARIARFRLEALLADG